MPIRNITAASLPITLGANDVICYPESSESDYIFFGGKPLNNLNSSTRIGKFLFHGSSATFTHFNDCVFLTPEITGACGFADLGAYFHGIKTPDRALRIQCTTLKPGVKVQEVTRGGEHASLFSPSGDPSDSGCKKYLEKNTQYQGLHFAYTESELGDAGTKDVWYILDGNLVTVKRELRLFLIRDSDPPKSLPKTLRVNGRGEFKP